MRVAATTLGFTVFIHNARLVWGDGWPRWQSREEFVTGILTLRLDSVRALRVVAEDAK